MTQSGARTSLRQLLSLPEAEGVSCYISEFAVDKHLINLVNGYIRKVPFNTFSAIGVTGLTPIQLVSGHELEWVRQQISDGISVFAPQSAMVQNALLQNSRRITIDAAAMKSKEGDKLAPINKVLSAVPKDKQQSTKDEELERSSGVYCSISLKQRPITEPLEWGLLEWKSKRLKSTLAEVRTHERRKAPAVVCPDPTLACPYEPVKNLRYYLKKLIREREDRLKLEREMADRRRALKERMLYDFYSQRCKPFSTLYELGRYQLMRQGKSLDPDEIYEELCREHEHFIALCTRFYFIYLSFKMYFGGVSSYSDSDEGRDWKPPISEGKGAMAKSPSESPVYEAVVKSTSRRHADEFLVKIPSKSASKSPVVKISEELCRRLGI